MIDLCSSEIPIQAIGYKDCPTGAMPSPVCMAGESTRNTAPDAAFWGNSCGPNGPCDDVLIVREWGGFWGVVSAFSFLLPMKITRCAHTVQAMASSFDTSTLVG